MKPHRNRALVPAWVTRPARPVDCLALSQRHPKHPLNDAKTRARLAQEAGLDPHGNPIR